MTPWEMRTIYPGYVFDEGEMMAKIDESSSDNRMRLRFWHPDLIIERVAANEGQCTDGRVDHEEYALLFRDVIARIDVVRHDLFLARLILECVEYGLFDNMLGADAADIKTAAQTRIDLWAKYDALSDKEKMEVFPLF